MLLNRAPVASLGSSVTNKYVPFRTQPLRSKITPSVGSSFSTGTAVLRAAISAKRASVSSKNNVRIPTCAFYTQESVPDQTGRVAIVTGSSSGMGFEVAKCLSQKNATVIIASRNLKKCQKAAAEIKSQGGKGRIEAMELDLTSFRSIKAFADKYLEMNLPIHMLVNNGGVFLVNHDHTQEGFETTVGTNYWGHFYLTHLLLDKMIETKKKSGGMVRGVVMSSTFEQLGQVNFDDLELYNAKESGLFEYSTSKIYVLMMAREMNKRLKGSGVEFYAAQPGLVSSPLYGKGDFRKLSLKLVTFVQSFYGQSPERGCRGLLRAVTDPELTGRGGQYFSPAYLSVATFHINNAGRFIPYHSSSRRDSDMQRLYDQSIKVVNEKLSGNSMPAISALS